MLDIKDQNSAVCVGAAAPASGGGGANDGEFLVQVIDYDGAVLKEARLNTGDTFTLPTPPTNHSRLVFDCWSSSAPIINNKVTVTNNDILIGPIYDTVSGLTEFDIYVPPSSVGVEGRFAVSGTKDWGDGTTSTDGSHTYTQSGFYTIKVDCTGFGGGQYNGVFVQYEYNDPVFRCMGVHCSSSVTSLGEYPLIKTWAQYCTLPSSLTSFNARLNLGAAVTCLIIPPGTTSLPENFVVNQPYQKIVLPYGLTTLGNSAIANTQVYFMPIPATCLNLGTGCIDGNNLPEIRLPDGITTVPAVKSRVPFKFVMPDTVTKCADFFNTTVYKVVAGRDFAEIGDGTFSYTKMVEWDFTKCAQIPTLASTSFDAGAVIKVPASLYAQWITETNWVSFADYIVGV